MRRLGTVRRAAHADADSPSFSNGHTRVPTRWLLLTAVAAGALALALGLTFGLRGQASDTPGVSGRLQSLLQAAGPLVVFSEFGEEADTLWAANPDDPADRFQLGRVSHAFGYGITPALSPDGKHVAYTVLPADGASAELWSLDTASGKNSRLAQGVDLMTGPVWSPASDAVVVRRGVWSEGGSASVQLVRVQMNGAEAQVASAEADLYPIDFSPDGARFYYAVVTSTGTELAQAPAAGGGPAQTVAHLSDGFSRDWRLSPDGTQLAYLGQAPHNAGVAFVVQVLDLQTRQVAAPLAGAGAALFNPLWERDGLLTVGRVDGGGAPVGIAMSGVDAGPPAQSLLRQAGGRGFDVPLSWSPDGVHLAVRSFQGSSAANPGPSYVEVLASDGGRQRLSPLSDVIIAGWLEVAP